MGARGPRPSTRLMPPLKAFRAILLTVGGNSSPQCRASPGTRCASATSTPSAQYRRGV